LENKGITELRFLEIIDACFHAYASDYRIAAQEMAKKLLAQSADK